MEEDTPVLFDASDRRIRCFAHIVNIIVQHVLSAISKSKASTEADDDEDESEDEDEGGSLPRARDLSIEQTFEEAAGRDPVGLARRLVRALRASNSRRSAFEASLKNGNAKGYFKLPVLELLRDVATRWDSTFLMIRRLIDLRAVSPFSVPTSTH